MLAHTVLLAIIARLAAPAAPEAPEQAGIPLLFQSVQPIGAAVLAPPDAAAPRLAPMAWLMVETGHPAAMRHDTAATSRALAVRPVPVQSWTATTTQSGAASAPARVDTTADGAALVPTLEARIDDAVRQAAIMPQAARRQHRQGRARVKFTYIDGRVNGVQLVATSESRLLDDAALEAVSRAAYPAPPTELRGRHLDLLVWVNFRMEA